ncbi:thiol-specific monooxygenase [Trichomonascus vanleenenianus]|uniref:thiol-specific monooxygenase n=1 Tax=Trichomonascus vanleenenianus TaxID=2268995 RepID=UPI003ECA7163
MKRTEKIAVIGAGPSGLTAIKTLLEEGVFHTIKCFEQSDRIGGLWNYNDSPAYATVPSENPHTKLDNWSSAMYNVLETNVVAQAMEYSDLPLASESTPIYIKRQKVLEYVHEYGSQLKQYVSFGHLVEKVAKDDSNGRWTLHIKDSHHGTTTQEQFDAVAFATGNFNMPFLPDRKGLKQWSEQFPGSVIHSKSYRHSESYKDQTVLIVGGATSAYDIAGQLAGTARKVYQSIRSRKVSPFLGRDDVHYLPDIAEFVAPKKQLIDEDGNTIDGVDSVIFATGYLRWYPALDDSVNQSSRPVVTDGARLHHVFEHLFYSVDPTLVFLATPSNIVPFPFAEAQAMYVSRVWAGRLLLPPLEDRLRWERERVESHGDGQAYHQLLFPENFDVVNEIVDRINTSTPSDLSTNDGRLHTWGQEARRIRGHTIQLKAGHEKFKHKMGRPAYSIDEMIEQGCFEWDPSIE